MSATKTQCQNVCWEPDKAVGWWRLNRWCIILLCGSCFSTCCFSCYHLQITAGTGKVCNKNLSYISGYFAAMQCLCYIFTCSSSPPTACMLPLISSVTKSNMSSCTGRTPPNWNGLRLVCCLPTLRVGNWNSDRAAITLKAMTVKEKVSTAFPPHTWLN